MVFGPASLGVCGACLWLRVGMEVIVCNANMDGRDIVAVMPTGGGKSLTYQLPAIFSSGVTLVISPLISLITDQIMHLLEAVKITGSTSKSEQDAIHMTLINMAAGRESKETEIKLLYCTPEKIAKSKQFTSLLQEVRDGGKLVQIIVDEAHCVSQIGHDFRPDYAKLHVLRELFPEVPIMALSATYPPVVLKDLLKVLSLKPTVRGTAAGHTGTVYFTSKTALPRLPQTSSRIPMVVNISSNEEDPDKPGSSGRSLMASHSTPSSSRLKPFPVRPSSSPVNDSLGSN
ncbi:hypothetical protein D9757_014064 [Collybiopsis confluens]|uniref:DNA 3'-5' helicase n=1 Tax=Collybiopsis confluens TaxID=2823264 RepID=A0A8H5FQW6_9AGAR|nr:hypothetical protein D9757_014064 [Collybiopsis confluens]